MSPESHAEALKETAQAHEDLHTAVEEVSAEQQSEIEKQRQAVREDSDSYGDT